METKMSEVRFHESADGIELKTGFENMDFIRVAQMLSNSYWVPGIQPDEVERAASHSAVVIGAFHGDTQVGYARVISDLTRMAYLADVYVDESFRGRGICGKMLSRLLELPELSAVPRWVLTTADAQSLYEKFGFRVVEKPENWMTLTRRK